MRYSEIGWRISTMQISLRKIWTFNPLTIPLNLIVLVFLYNRKWFAHHYLCNWFTSVMEWNFILHRNWQDFLACGFKVFSIDQFDYIAGVCNRFRIFHDKKSKNKSTNKQGFSRYWFYQKKISTPPRQRSDAPYR